MARWKLTAGHYLNVPGTEWEYKETNRETGRQVRKIYPVPRHLDPKSPEDWNYRSSPYEDGEIIVCHEGKGQPKDIPFQGMPTADMDPLDDEARDLSAKIPKKKDEYAHMSLGEGILEDLMAKLSQVQAPLAPVSTAGIDPNEFQQMKDMMKQLMEQNAKLQAEVAEKQVRR